MTTIQKAQMMANESGEEVVIVRQAEEFYSGWVWTIMLADDYDRGVADGYIFEDELYEVFEPEY